MSAQLSRRDFLKLASVSALALAASRLPAGMASSRRRPLGPGRLEVLSARQQERLARVSRQFIAPEEELANQVALEIDFIEGANEHASTMCGPLTLSILKAADLLDAWVQPAKFWLLNPDEESGKIADILPHDLYDWHEFEQPVAEFDFNRFPLAAGDILYLYAGPNDTFEHILVVNRVDEVGRPHTVSNFFTENGTIIEERALYDPQYSSNSQFQEWANRKYRNTRGMTGGGGFRVWRVKNATLLDYPQAANAQELRRELDVLLLPADGAWHSLIQQIGGPVLYRFNPYERFHPASVIKLPIALAFYAWLEDRAPDDVDAYIAEEGTHERSFAQLLEAMIVDSEEAATEALVDFLKPSNIENTWRAWGLKFTQLDPRRSTSSELALAFSQLYAGDWVSPWSRQHLLSLLASYTPNDDTRIGRLKQSVNPDFTIYNKRSSLVAGPRVVGDSALVSLPGTQDQGYFISLHGLGSDGASYESLEETLAAAVNIFGEFLSTL